MDELLGTPAVASMVGISLRSLARWTSQGLIAPELVTPTGHCRWSVAGLDRQLEALTVRTTDDG